MSGGTSARTDIELVVFDIAGTTVEDPDGVGRCLRGALGEAGLIVSDPSAIAAVMGLPKPEAIRLLIEGSDQADSFRDRVEEIHEDFVRRMIRFHETDPDVREVPGAVAVFRLLRAAGIRVGLDTGFGRAEVDALMERLGWTSQGLIDATISSDEVARGRPHPEMIERLMERLGVTDPARVAKVGDTPSDLEEGTNAGCALVVGVCRGTHSREQLAEFPHTHLIDTVAELPGLLGLG
jgi:phosphonatase-like hydrolase